METTYPSIKGPAFEHLGRPCVAFHKYDGSNLRFLWQEAARCAVKKRYGVRR